MQVKAEIRDALVAGACFTYQGSKYRLNTFMCEEEVSPLPECQIMAELLAEWRAEDAASVPEGMRRFRLRHCLPFEATFVSGSGVCGCIAPIADIEINGLVRWTEEELTEHHEKALKKGREARYAVTITRSAATGKGV
jgi:hypothetical protein